jgi:hypothetical protein
VIVERRKGMSWSFILPKWEAKNTYFIMLVRRVFVGLARRPSGGSGPIPTDGLYGLFYHGNKVIYHSEVDYSENIFHTKIYSDYYKKQTGYTSQPQFHSCKFVEKFPAKREE